MRALAILLLILGLVLLVVAGVRYITARDTQRELQSTQDLRWNAEVVEYARQTPPMLPPGPPEPVPLPDRNSILSLMATSQTLLACGGLCLFLAVRRQRSPARQEST